MQSEKTREAVAAPSERGIHVVANGDKEEESGGFECALRGGGIQVIPNGDSEGRDKISGDDGFESSLRGGVEVKELENLGDNHYHERLDISFSCESELEGATGMSGIESVDQSVGESASRSGLSKNELGLDGMLESDLRKRRKKKKRKKIAKDVLELDQFAALEAQMLPPEIADKRYLSSLESMQSDSSLIWMQLNKCRITEKKARKLFEALKDYTTLTSLDLSENLLTDKSLQYLMDALIAGSAPNLIHIDLRDNPISNKSQHALECIQNLRQHLKVDFNLKAPTQVLGVSAGAYDDRWMEGNRRNNFTPKEKGCSSTIAEKPMPYFHQRLTNPEALQEKVEFALLSIKKSSNILHVSGLASSLREVIIKFSQQLYQNPYQTKWMTLEQLPKGLALLLEKLGMFLSILDMNPAPVLCQRRLEERAVGLHRIALVELLNLVLVPVSQCIEDKLLAEGTPARLVSLFFQFHWNNILQGALYRALQAMLSKPSIRFSLLEGPIELPSLLSREGEKCAAFPIGKRPGHGGYIVRLSKEIEFLGVNDGGVQNILGQNWLWMNYIRPGGPLQQMIAEQSGNLGGPKPTFTKSVSQFYYTENCRGTSELDRLCGLSLS